MFIRDNYFFIPGKILFTKNSYIKLYYTLYHPLAIDITHKYIILAE